VNQNDIIVTSAVHQINQNIVTPVSVAMCVTSDVLITNLGTDISYEGLCSEMRDICKFDSDQPFTVKWVDEEGLSHRIIATCAMRPAVLCVLLPVPLFSVRLLLPHRAMRPAAYAIVQCPSVCLSVCLSVCPSVRPSVRPSVTLY